MLGSRGAGCANSCSAVDRNYLGKLEYANVGEVFLPIDIELIRAIPLSTRRTTDLWSWFFEKNGIFSVKSAYRMIVDTKRRREDWIE
jgi:hypothetical protein